MSDAVSQPQTRRPHRPVIAGIVPGQPARVLREAAQYARLHGAALLIAHVDITRFVSYEDPDGYVHTAPINLDAIPSEALEAQLRDQATAALSGIDVAWSLEMLAGDPALAMKDLAERTEARLIVVGTRKRGIGDSIREFFTGSVAARLAHRQPRPVLVVPLGEPVKDDEDLWRDRQDWPEELWPGS
ncbi:MULTISPECIES: universal stress protein [unclassified Microbacterium]|uniref:universal stress protein n=1 Tax=unclassified Microbacterium TaxID=2609290 RepID=UPI003C2D849A